MHLDVLAACASGCGDTKADPTSSLCVKGKLVNDLLPLAYKFIEDTEVLAQSQT